jgi:hypothetical protein
VTCSTCAFFDRNDNATGLCRLVPPTVIPAQHLDGSVRQTKPFTTWPLVRNNDWCGEHVDGDWKVEVRKTTP